MSPHDWISLAEKKFFAKLDEKTGWGRNQIKQAFKEAVAEAALEYASKA